MVGRRGVSRKADATTFATVLQSFWKKMAAALPSVGFAVVYHRDPSGLGLGIIDLIEPLEGRRRHWHSRSLRLRAVPDVG